MTRLCYMFLAVITLTALACVDDPVQIMEFGQIEGTITDLSTDLPLEGVVITTNPSSQTLTSDTAGYFVFDSLPVDNYALRFRKDGFDTENLVSDLSSVAAVSLQVFMDRDYSSNLPPMVPTPIHPANSSEVQDLSTVLKWAAMDSDPEDSLTYDLFFFRANETGGEQLLTQSVQDSFTVENLRFGTVYNWQVVVYDGINEPVYSPVWQFRVRSRPNMPILFVREIADNFQVWMSSTDGETNRLYENFNTAWRPKRSPAGDRIAFLSFIGTDAHIFVSNTIGEEIRRVTTVPVGGYDLDQISFSWSPEGDRLIYPAFESLYVINVDGTGLTELAEAPQGLIFEGVDWSLFNNQIVARIQGDLPYENQLYEVSYPEGRLTLLVDDLPGTIGNPSLSVDGQRLIYSLDLSGLEVSSGRQNNASVILTSLVDNDPPVNVSAFKPGGYNDVEPQFSPTEAEIIVSEWLTTESDAPNIVSIPLNDLNMRETLIENARSHDWKE